MFKAKSRAVFLYCFKNILEILGGGREGAKAPVAQPLSAVSDFITCTSSYSVRPTRPVEVCPTYTIQLLSNIKHNWIQSAATLHNIPNHCTWNLGGFNCLLKAPRVVFRFIHKSFS